MSREVCDGGMAALSYFKCFCASSTLFLAGSASAQQIDLSLHATAVPDSFEVRARSTSGSYNGLANAVFTIRWEVAAGGAMDNSDVHSLCGAYTLSNSTGLVDVLSHRYFTLNLFGYRPLYQAGCLIDTSGLVICGFRIRELTGCRNVELAQNGYTWLNNYAYYFAMNGNDVTGEITSGAFSSGDCPPCEPPEITDIVASAIPYCGYGVDLSATATGTTLDYSWFDSGSNTLGWLPQILVPYGSPGTYSVVVTNVCGADTANVEAVVDTGLCVPPVFDSVWYALWNGWGGPGIQLFASVTGSCSHRTWEMPWGDVVSANPQDVVNVPNPTDGIYIAVVSNDCGEDTMELVLQAPEPCSGPSVSNVAIIASDSCYTGPVEFAATVGGPGPITTAWHAPDGTMLTGSPEFELPFAPWGSYQFIASNYCTIDTVMVFHGPADTTGLAACEPPQILSVGPDLVTCFSDTLRLIASTVLSGPCARMEWSSVDILSVSGDTSIAIFNEVAPIVLTLTNACGQVSADVPIEVVYQQQLLQQLCRTPEPISLDSLMHLSFSFEGGDWILAGSEHGNIYDPAVDTSGLYQYYTYVTPTAYCHVVDLYIQEFPGVYAGEDTAFVVCETDPPFYLFSMVAGEPQPGGVWLSNGSPVLDTFDPEIDPSGVYTYRLTVYQNLGFACTEEADLTIDVVATTLWYADTDGDGLGDPTTVTSACEQPMGQVTNADDDCPELFGVVGDSCDDGDPGTVDDIITEACICEGDSGTGIPQDDLDGFSLWPNPSMDGAFFLHVPSAFGPLGLTVRDVAGRVVLRSLVTASPNPTLITFPDRMATGSYCVEVNAARHAWTGRLMVGH